jgi:hypothetical protein
MEILHLKKYGQFQLACQKYFSVQHANVELAAARDGSDTNPNNDRIMNTVSLAQKLQDGESSSVDQ